MGQSESAEERASLKVFSLNTGLSGRQEFTEPDPSRPPSWRLNRILDFISHESPDVVLLQEVYKGDWEKYSRALGGPITYSKYCALSLTDRIQEAEGWGVAIGSKRGLFDIREYFYDKDPIDPNIVILNNGSEHAHSLLRASVGVGSERFTFGTTHFTWHNQAQPSELQLRDFEKLAEILKSNPDLVLTGDFNSPRGSLIFDSIAQIYTDNIPQEIDTTNDISIRPEATWRLVIDGFFTSQHYQVGDLSLVKGLSDHQGILASVQRISGT